MCRLKLRAVLVLGLAVAGFSPATRVAAAEALPKTDRQDAASPGRELRQRLERALDGWCRWLAGYLRQVPGTA